MNTAKDLVKALLKAAESAASGTADTAQVAALCQCTDTLIRLARLELEAAEYLGGKPVRWLCEREGTAPEPEKLEPKPRSNGVVNETVSDRISQIQKEVDSARKELLNPKTNPTMRDVLEDKIQKWEDRIKFLSKTAKIKD